uniref:Uncharacterized protein n=1 Tax=Arundo donax TaxID=35708 RepID=A0A0A9EHY1_ARUDO
MGNQSFPYRRRLFLSRQWTSLVRSELFIILWKLNHENSSRNMQLLVLLSKIMSTYYCCFYGSGRLVITLT